MHMLSVIKGKILDQVEGIAKDYMIRKYGDRAILCVLYAEYGKAAIKFLGHGSPAVWGLRGDMNAELIRKQCGQHAYMKFGLPLPEQGPIISMLMITPSAVKALGVVKSIELIRNWPGDSKIGLVPVVQYVLK